MNWKFWENKGFMPSIPEKLAAHSKMSRGSMMVLFGSTGVVAIGTMVYLSFIGIDNIQISNDVKIAEKASTVLFASFGSISAIFWGIASGASGKTLLRILALVLVLTCGSLDVVSTFKGRSSNLTMQDSVRDKAVLAIKAKDDQIKDAEVLITTLKVQATPKSDVVLDTKFSYLKLDAEAKNAARRKDEKNAASKLEEAIAKKAALLKERAELPNPPATESSILGGETANMLRLISSICLWFISIVSFRYFGEVAASFSVHKTNKFVRENTRNEAIERREEPIKQPANEPFMRDVPPPPAKPKRQDAPMNDAPPPPAQPDPIDLANAAKDLAAATAAASTLALTPTPSFSATEQNGVAVAGLVEKAPENAPVVPSSTLVAPSSSSVAVESATGSALVAPIDESATEAVAPSSIFDEVGSASVAPANLEKSEDDLFDFLNGGVQMTIPAIIEFMGCDADKARELRKAMRSRGISDRVSMEVVRGAIESKKSRPQSGGFANSSAVG